MQVNQITVRAGRTFNHPIESYSNLRCDAEMTATLDPGEDPIAATKSLRSQVETLCEEHKQEMLESIIALEERQRMTSRRISLQDQIERLQGELQSIDERQSLSLTANGPDDPISM